MATTTRARARTSNGDRAVAAGWPRRRDVVVYWISTGIVGAALLFGVVNFTFNDHFPEWDPNGPPAFEHLGLPVWFKWELIVAKLLALPAILVPRVPRRVREFAYFGFGLTLVSAVIAHAASGDLQVSILFAVQPIFFLGALVVSYLYLDKVER
jgi:DoxX-like family